MVARQGIYNSDALPYAGKMVIGGCALRLHGQTNRRGRDLLNQCQARSDKSINVH